MTATQLLPRIPAFRAGLVAAVTLLGARARAPCREWSPGFHANGMNAPILTLRAIDDGSGARLYADGTFTVAGEALANSITSFDGTTWSALGSGSSKGANHRVNAVLLHDDGSGPAVFIGGNLAEIGGVISPFIAKWKGTSGSSLGTGLDAGGVALAAYDDGHGTGPALDVAGGFARAGDTASSRNARWGGCRGSEFCAGDGLDAAVTTPCPCANPGAPGRGRAWSANAVGARLEVDGRIDPDAIVLRGSLMPATTTAIYLKGSANNGGAVVFGDGVRCVDGALIRLAIKQNAGGASQFPEPGNLSVSVRGATPPGSGLTGWCQTDYRSASPTFCPPATFNVTNGVMVRW